MLLVHMYQLDEKIVQVAYESFHFITVWFNAIVQGKTDVYEIRFAYVTALQIK